MKVIPRNIPRSVKDRKVQRKLNQRERERETLPIDHMKRFVTGKNMEEESEEKFSFSFHVSFFFFVSRTFFKMIRGKSEFFQEKNVTLVKIIYDTGERGVEKSGEK